LKHRLTRLVCAALLATLAGCAAQLQGPRNYLVYFVLDSADLTPEAKQVVATIVEARTEFGPSHITVEGRADGGTPHDATLADERARAVSQALVAAGIDPAMIALQPSAPPPGITGVAAHQVTVRFLP
jgi:outer membrane protein OmpA-like peptidoglycan-associated protein